MIAPYKTLITDKFNKKKKKKFKFTLRLSVKLKASLLNNFDK